MSTAAFAPGVTPYHVGCVALDVDAACAGLSAAFGVSWTPVQERTLDARVVPEGRRQFNLRFAYSLTPLHIEVIEHAPGTLWTSTGGFAIHHLGYWTDDLVGDHARLIGLGWECAYSGATDEHDGVVRGAYLRAPSGPLVEIVDIALRPAFEDLVRTASATSVR